MKSTDIKAVNGIECPICHDRIYSRYTHAMRWCKCGYCAIDGGRDYERVIWGNKENGSTLLPKTIEMSI